MLFTVAQTLQGHTALAWERGWVDNFYQRKRTFLTQVEVRWSVGIKVPEGVRPSPANGGQLEMNVVLFM